MVACFLGHKGVMRALLAMPETNLDQVTDDGFDAFTVALVSGKVWVNVGVFIGAPSRFDWNRLVVANLAISPIVVAVSGQQAAALVTAGSELSLMPARYLYQMIRPKQGLKRPLLVWRAAINAVLTTLVTLSGATRMANCIRDRTRYQQVLVDAIAKMRQRDAKAGENLKFVTLENGERIRVPQHIQAGQKVVVNVDDGSFSGRSDE